MGLVVKWTTEGLNGALLVLVQELELRRVVLRGEAVDLRWGRRSGVLLLQVESVIRRLGEELELVLCGGR